MTKSLAYLFLKASNLAAATVWSFALVYVLVRVLPSKDYAAFIVLAAVAGYLMVGDLGLTSVAYTKLRASFLSKSETPVEASSLGVLLLIAYALIATIAWILFAIVQLIAPIGSGNQTPGFLLYFLSLTLALPWAVVRSILMSHDRFLRYECVELIRRLAGIASVIALSNGLSLVEFAILSLLGWAFALAAVLKVVAKILSLARFRRLSMVAQVIRSSLRQGYNSSTFSLLEFAVFNFPYLVIPLMYNSASTLIAYDVFFKVVRFGAQSNYVAFESSLPAITRSIHDRNQHALLKGATFGLSVAVGCAAVGSVLIIRNGEQIFDRLLASDNSIPRWMLWAMSLMLFADAGRACAAIFMMNTGNISRLLSSSWAGVVAFAILIASAIIFEISFRSFMLYYTLLFSMTSFLYFFLMVRRFRSFTR